MNSELFMDKRCFACGSDNANGLKLNIKEYDGGVEALIELPLWTQGYHNTVHGGIICTILDEMTVWAAYLKEDLKCITGELNVRIRTSMQVNEKYKARAKVVRVKHQLVIVNAELIDKNNNLVAQAQAKLIRISSIQADRECPNS